MNIMPSGLRPAPESDAPASESISYSIAASSLGALLVARSAAGVCSIQLGQERQMLEAELAAEFPGARLVMDDDAVKGDIAKIIAFIEQPGDGLHVTLDRRGTAFQHKVWDILLTIPAGTTISYSELADRLGEPGSARAVAGACAANKIALAIPCHRVVRSNGDLSGYRWGVERKRSLLEREAAA